MSHAPWIALTDQAWFDHFSEGKPTVVRVDEVNFWSPTSVKPMKRMRPGEPVFFRLKVPHRCIAGYGFFAHFCVLGLEEAWRMFGAKNGDPERGRFMRRIGGYRRLDLDDPSVERAPLGCTILRDAVFWPRERWLRWDEREGWPKHTQRGKAETDPVRASRLLAEIQHDSLEVPQDLVAEFAPLEVDERELVLARTRARVGQGTFRSRLLDAYGRRCAVTGEKTEPVLDAAHVQPYLGPRSNHPQNGLLLTQEFHTLFDLGLVTVTPDFRLRVSDSLRERWSNGRRYYAYQGSPIRTPESTELRPSRAALEWHVRRVFVG